MPDTKEFLELSLGNKACAFDTTRIIGAEKTKVNGLDLDLPIAWIRQRHRNALRR